MGAHVHFGKRKRRGTHTDRIREAIGRAKRVGCLPLPRSIKSEIVGAAVIPMALHEVLTTLLPGGELRSLRTACYNAISGKRRAKRAHELLGAFAGPGRRVDPMFALTYGRLRDVRSLLLGSPDMPRLFELA